MEFYILTTENKLDNHLLRTQNGNLDLILASERMIFYTFERAEYWVKNTSTSKEKYACCHVYMSDNDAIFCLSQMFYSGDTSCFNDCKVKIFDIKWL